MYGDLCRSCGGAIDHKDKDDRKLCLDCIVAVAEARADSLEDR